MDIDTAASTAQTFLKKYIRSNKYFTPPGEVDPDNTGSLRLSFFRAVPLSKEPDTLMYTFLYGDKMTGEDPDVKQWVQQSMDALKAAHPEVFEFKQVIDIERFE